MEFLVMPQLADSLIECYSAPGSGCTHCNTILYCDCFNGAGCACNNGGGCTCNTGGTCDCFVGHNDCPCFGVYTPDCPNVGCRTRCTVDLGVLSTPPIV